MNFVHVLSIHHQVPQWVGWQRRSLNEHMNVSHDRTFIVDGIEKSEFQPSERLLNLDAHAIERMELLSSTFRSCPADDWLLFIDSDAFILRDISELLALDSNFIAIQRTDNGDWHPHPSFTLVRAGLWQEIGPRAWDARPWINAKGERVSEMGGELLHRVQERQIPWTKLTRVNQRGLHPLWFGVYGLNGEVPVAYHHGAGSRTRTSRSDRIPRRQLPETWGRKLAWASTRRRQARFDLSIPEVLRGDPDVLNEHVLRSIDADADFWRRLL